MDIKSIVKNFLSSCIDVEEIFGGHINRTFKIRTESDNYILQVMNSDAFSNIEAIMDNISLVCKYLQSRSIPTLEYIPSLDGRYYYITSQGKYVRVCKYIENSISLEFSNDLEIIYNVGRGFGQFSYSLSYIDGSKIIDTIPNFHNTEYYLNRIFNIKEVSKHADDILNNLYYLRDYAKVTQSMSRQVTHNDTRFNNILLDKNTKNPLCVIDLDTIMNGYIAYDFADGVRSICKDRNNLLDISKFDAYSKGFLSYPISITDKSTLIDSIVAVSLELSARYLYEYLNRSNYFNLSTINDNLLKSRLNLRFAKDVLSKKDTILKLE